MIGSTYNPAMQSPVALPIAVDLGTWREGLASRLARGGVSQLAFDHSVRPTGGKPFGEELASADLLPLSDFFAHPSETMLLHRFIARQNGAMFTSALRQWQAASIRDITLSVTAHTPVHEAETDGPGTQRLTTRVSWKSDGRGSLKLYAYGLDSLASHRFARACQLMGVGSSALSGLIARERRDAHVACDLGSAWAARRNDHITVQIGDVAPELVDQLRATAADMIDSEHAERPYLRVTAARLRSVPDYLAADSLFDALGCSALRHTQFTTVDRGDGLPSDVPWVLPHAAWRLSIGPGGYLSQTHLVKYQDAGGQPRAVLLIDAQRPDEILEIARQVSPLCEQIALARPAPEAHQYVGLRGAP